MKRGVRLNDLCTTRNNASYIFWECEIVQLVWHSLRDFIYRETNKDIDISKKSAVFGQQFNDCMSEKT